MTKISNFVHVRPFFPRSVHTVTPITQRDAKKAVIKSPLAAHTHSSIAHRERTLTSAGRGQFYCDSAARKRWVEGVWKKKRKKPTSLNWERRPTQDAKDSSFRPKGGAAEAACRPAVRVPRPSPARKPQNSAANWRATAEIAQRSCTREAAFCEIWCRGRSALHRVCAAERAAALLNTHHLSIHPLPRPQHRVTERGRRREKHPRPAATSASRGVGGQTCECVCPSKCCAADPIGIALLYRGGRARPRKATHETRRRAALPAYYSFILWPIDFALSARVSECERASADSASRRLSHLLATWFRSLALFSRRPSQAM